MVTVVLPSTTSIHINGCQGHGAAFRGPSISSLPCRATEIFNGTPDSPVVCAPPDDVLLADMLESMDSDILPEFPMMPQQELADFIHYTPQYKMQVIDSEAMDMCLDNDSDDEAEGMSGGAADMAAGTNSEQDVSDSLNSPVFDEEDVLWQKVEQNDSVVHRNRVDIKLAQSCGEHGQKPQKPQKRVRFHSTNQVRTIPAVTQAMGVDNAQPADAEAWMKRNDGPSHSSIQIDRLVRAMFEHRTTTVERLQAVLGPQACAEVQAAAPEIAGRLYSLAECLAQLTPEVGRAHIGLLPSNVRLGARHAPGIRQLARWLWSG